MKIVQIKEFTIDKYGRGTSDINGFLSEIPADDVLDIKYQTYIDEDEHDWYSNVLIVYKTEKAR